MKIISWNVNGVRAREKQVRNLIKKERPDVLMLQETKAPLKAFYEVFKDQKDPWTTVAESAYGGTAVYTKNPHLIYTMTSSSILIKYRNIYFMNVYVPCGIKDDEAFEHKLGFIQSLRKQIKEFRGNVIIGGDFNVCLNSEDCFDPSYDGVTCTDEERYLYKSFFPRFNDVGTSDYTFWDYRDRELRQGLRLDYFFMTRGLQKYFRSYRAMVEYRTKERPSDHVPIKLVISKRK